MEIIIENNTDQTIDERKLIKKWKRKHDESIAMYFFEKYKDKLVDVIYAKIDRKFSSIPLEKGDLFYIVWKSINNCLRKYDETKSLSFKNYLMNNTYTLVVREALKFLNNKHIVLNTAYSYDKLSTKFRNFDFGKNGRVGIVSNFEEARRKFIDQVVDFNNLYDVPTLKRVIYLKSLGYTLDEIAKKMGKKKYDVKKIVDYIILIAKKLYE